MKPVFPLPNESYQTRELIKNKLVAKQINNPRYSLRLLSKRVEIDSGSLSAYLNGHREFPVKILLIILKELSLDEEQVNACLGITLEAIKKDSSKVISKFNQNQDMGA